VTSMDAATVALPGDFSVRKVVFTLDDAAGAEVTPNGIVSTDFGGMANGSPYPASGPSADAAEELHVRSRGSLEKDMIKIMRF
jgi:hypothetical protein